MKTLKFTIFLFLIISLTSCGSDDDEPTFVLSNANIAGTYSISSLTADETETATSSSGSITVLTTIVTVGSIFQVNFVINSNGTYTASGEYLLDITETPNMAGSTHYNEIINFETSGAYQLNTTNNTITFNPANGEFLEGELNIVTFNENTISLTQEEIDVDSGLTTTSNGKITFTRK